MKKLLLILSLLLVPTVAHGAINLNVAPCDSTSKFFHYDGKWTATGGLDTLQAGATFDHIKVWLTAGETHTFDLRLVPWSANALKQRGTAPPAAWQLRANWGGTLNTTAFHTYAVTDVCEFEQNAPIWRGFIVQSTAGVVINFSLDRMDPVAPTR